MSRRTLAAAVLLTTISCADTGGITRMSGDATAPLAAKGASCSAQDGQAMIDAGQYKQAIQEFSCLVAVDRTAIEGYRGRIEAELMLGLFSDAVRDYTRVNAFVVPVHPDAMQTIITGYAARLDAAPDDIVALTGQSFAYWWDFNYPAAMHVLDHLLEVRPNDVYGNAFRGSSRLLRGAMRAEGAADLDRAIALAPESPDVRFIDGDAFTYGRMPDAQRAFDDATFALTKGLNTPRVRAIRASSYLAFGDTAAAAVEIGIHFDLVTTQLLVTAPLTSGSALTLAVAPGRVYEIPVTVTAGETVSLATSSKDFWDSILVLLAPDGTPVLGSDDFAGYMAGFVWVPPASDTYRVRVSSFEAVSTGDLVVAWK